MSASYTEYYFQLVDTRTNRTVDDDAGQFIVYTADSPVKATVYSNEFGTALTQPGTLTNGVGRFWTASDVTTVDVAVLTETGRGYNLIALTPSQHRIDVDHEKTEYSLTLGWAVLSAHGDGVVSALGFQLQTGMLINDVIVQKTSVGVGVSTGLIIDFGVSGDPDGFVDGVTSTVTGYYLNGVVIASDTEAANIVAGVQLRGALLRDFHTGLSGITASIGSPGFFVRKPYLASLVTTTNNLVFAINGTSALTTVAGSKGYVYLQYSIIPTAGN